LYRSGSIVVALGAVRVLTSIGGEGREDGQLLTRLVVDAEGIATAGSIADDVCGLSVALQNKSQREPQREREREQVGIG
jgi:hypothetical protein